MRKIIIDLSNSDNYYLYVEQKVLHVIQSSYDFIRSIDHLSEFQEILLTFVNQELIDNRIISNSGLYDFMGNKLMAIDDNNTFEKSTIHCNISIKISHIKNDLNEIIMDINVTIPGKSIEFETETIILDKDFLTIIKCL
jgi:hypothetical protein